MPPISSDECNQPSSAANAGFTTAAEVFLFARIGIAKQTKLLGH